MSEFNSNWGYCIFFSKSNSLFSYSLLLKYSHRKITMTLTQAICPKRIAFRAGKKKGERSEGLAPNVLKISCRTETQPQIKLT